MATLREVQTKFTANAEKFMSIFGPMEQALDNLPKISERATKRMNDDFEKVGESLDDFNDNLKKTGKEFDTKKVSEGLKAAQKEFKETGNVSKETMESLNKEINDIEWKSLDANSRKAFKEVIGGAKDMERQMNKLNDVEFLENLPDDAREAGKSLLLLEKDADKAKKKLDTFDNGFDADHIKSEIDKAKKELKETGQVSEQTAKTIQANFKMIDLDGLTDEAKKELEDLKQQAKKVDDVINDMGSNSNMSGLANQTEDATGKVGKLTGAIKGIGPMLAASLGGAALVGFAKQVVETTAEIDALKSQYEQVMGGMKEDTDKYLDQMSDKWNKHPNELKNAYMQYVAILKSKGVEEKNAHDIAQQYLERTVDANAFANESMEDTVARFMAGAKGEFDSLDTAMVNLNVTMLDSKAQEKYGKEWKNLNVTQQETLKAQEMLRQHTSAGVFGQGEREADSYANNLAMLKKTWEDFIASYGGPALNVANQGLKGALEVVKRLEGGFKAVAGFIKDMQSTQQTDVLKKLGFSNAEVNNIINWFNLLKQQLSIAGGAVIDFVKNGLGQIKAFFAGPDGQQLLQAVKNITGGILAAFKFVFPLIKYIVVSVWQNITGVISGAFQVIKGLLQVFSGLFTGDFKKMWEGVKNIFSGAIKLIWNGVQLLFYGKLLKGGIAFAKLFAGGLKSMWSSIVAFFKTFGSNIAKGTVGAFNSLKSGVVKIFSGLVKWLGSTTKNVVSAIINFFKNLGTGSVKLFTTMKNGISKIWNAIKTTAYNAAKYVKDKVFGFFSGMWTNVSNKMGQMKKGLFSSWDSIKKTAFNAGNYVKDKVVGAFQNTWKGVSNWIGKIKDGVKGMKDSVVKKATEMKDGLKKNVVGGLNTMIDSINWVADKIGMGKPIDKIKYSTGTSGHPQDGWATVGDKGPGNGKGTREIVQFPNGKSALFEEETTFWMPKGTHVYSNQETEPILDAMAYSKGTGIGAKVGAAWNAGSKKVEEFANGAKTVVKKTAGKVKDFAGDVWDYATNPSKLLNLALDKFGVNFGDLKGFPKLLMSTMFGKLKSGASKLIQKWFDESGNADGGEILGFKLTTPYSPNARPPGYPFNAHHYGIDLATPSGTLLHAPTSGTLSQTNDRNGGLTAILRDKLYTQFFMHLSSVLKSGDVKKGEAIVRTGNSGEMTTGPHLHYQVRKNDGTNNWNTNTIDPIKFLNSHGAGGGSGVTGKGNWAAKIRQAAAQMKTSVTDAQVNGILAQIQRESNFNESITQSSAVWDVNMANGTPARGLLQYVPSTFANFAVKGYGNINNGYHQLLAFFNNSNWKNDIQYGQSGWGPRGTRRYADGGIITKPHFGIVGEAGNESIIPHDPRKKARANELLAQTYQIVNGPIKYASGTKKPAPKKTAAKATTKVTAVPKKTTTKTVTKNHKIVYGDTLSYIAKKYGTTVADLKKANGLKSDLIIAGKTLKVPVKTQIVETVKKPAAKNTAAAKKTTKAPTKKATAKPKPKPKTRMQELTGIAADLVKKGNADTAAKTSKAYIEIGKLIADKLKTYKKDSVDTIYKNVKAIVSKIDSTVKSNTSKIASDKVRIGTYEQKNKTEQQKINELLQEKRLNQKKGLITTKTKLPPGSTKRVDESIANNKKRQAEAAKKQKALEAERKKMQASLAKANAKEQAKIKKQIAAQDKRIASEKKKQQTAIANLKKYEKQRHDILNRYKVTTKTVSGRSAAQIDKLIASAKTKITNNNKTIAQIKKETKAYEAQNKSLTAIKKNEVLKADVLTKLIAKREELQAKLDALTKKRDRLKEEKQSYTDSLSENMQGYAGFGAAKGNTARDFLEFMRYRLGRLRKFASNVTKLRGMGLDPQIMRDMLAGGVDSAMPKVEALIAGGQGIISQINAMQAEVNSVIKSISTEQAGYAYDPEIADNANRIKNAQNAIKANDVDARKYLDTAAPVKKTTTTKTTAKTPAKTTAKPAAKKTTTKIVNQSYKIKSGDTLSGIAKKYGTTVAELKKINGLKSDLIIAGKTMKVPVKVQVEVEDKGTTTKKTTKTTTKNHKIAWGDTLSGIAAKYGTTVAELKKYNGLKDDTIIAGKTLKIPIKTEVVEIVSKKTVQAPAPAKTTTTTTAAKTTTTTAAKVAPAKVKPTSHLIKAGESLSSIAAKYKTTVAALKKINNMKNDLIIAGKSLKLPADIKAYAKGGIVSRPQLAWIAEGGFAESIISHDPSMRAQQRNIWQKTGEKLGFTGSMSTDESINLLEQMLAVQKAIAAKDTTIVMNNEVVGRQVSGAVDRNIAQNIKYRNRGLANGR